MAPIKVIDCFGDFCPIPLLKTKNEVKKLAPGQSFMVVTDHSCVLESHLDYFKHRPENCSYQEPLAGVWEITITKPIIGPA